MLGEPAAADLNTYRACMTPPVEMLVRDSVPMPTKGVRSPNVSMTPAAAALRDNGPLATPITSEHITEGLALTGFMAKYARPLNWVIQIGGEGSRLVSVFCTVHVSAATGGP